MTFKNTEDNRDALARQVVDSMDFDDMFTALVDRIAADYKHDDDLFQEDAEDIDFMEPAEPYTDD